MRKETLLKIIGLFRKNLDKGMTMLEIAKTLKIGYRPAYNHLLSMQKEGVININRVGKARQCFINLKSEKARLYLQEADIARKEGLFKNTKLRGIFESLMLNLEPYLQAGIRSIILFGSYARGSAAKSSDVDLIFIIDSISNKPLRELIEKQCVGFRYSHNTKVSPVFADIAEFRKMLASKELNIGKEALSYGIPLCGPELFWELAA
ncbi:MAG: nucleotidyltransferase domain-containing protein [Nanoarchaeota archaeon]|nr:nucleotidyltransferase domain-containing protein [Nanoarchaeota archaeon]